jgi:hypothetical protein
MNNLIKINNGFVMNNKSYIFQQFDSINTEEPDLVSYQIISSSQVFVGTDRGIILLDLTFTIDDVAYSNIDEFINQLFK